MELYWLLLELLILLKLVLQIGIVCWVCCSVWSICAWGLGLLLRRVRQALAKAVLLKSRKAKTSFFHVIHISAEPAIISPIPPGR